MATNQGFKSLVPHKGLLEAKYAYHWLRANKAYLESLGNGATFKELSKAALSRVSIPLPPMEEQRRIAAILDQTDVLSAKRRAAIAGLTDAQGALLSVFAPPDRTALRRIGDLAGVQTGPFGSLLHQADYVEGGIPLVNPVHIVDGRIRTDPKNAVKPDKWERLGSYHLQAGDVVLARRGEMGRAAVVTKSEAGFLCGTGSMIIRAHAGVVHPVYLAAALSSLTSRDRLLRVSLGTTLPNLNSKIVEDFELPVPAYEAQMAFAEAMSEVDQIRGRMDQSLDALGDLASSLATSAFKGEL